MSISYTLDYDLMKALINIHTIERTCPVREMIDNLFIL